MLYSLDRSNSDHFGSSKSFNFKFPSAPNSKHNELFSQRLGGIARNLDQQRIRHGDPRTTPNESRSRKSRGTRAGGDKSAWTPGEIDGNTIRRDQRTLYKLKQISRLIIINPRAALIIERRPRPSAILSTFLSLSTPSPPFARAHMKSSRGAFFARER